MAVGGGRVAVSVGGSGGSGHRLVGRQPDRITAAPIADIQSASRMRGFIPGQVYYIIGDV